MARRDRSLLDDAEPDEIAGEGRIWTLRGHGCPDDAAVPVGTNRYRSHTAD